MPAYTAHPLPWRRLFCLALPLLLTACASHEAAPAVAKRPPMEQRLSDLERRVQRLEARPAVPAPHRDRGEIEAYIGKLRSERERLLLKYTEQYPAVRDIDRQLGILNEQLRRLAP